MKSKKFGGKEFQKGGCANPLGAAILPPGFLKQRNMTKADVTMILNKFLYWPQKDLVKFLEDPNSPVIEVMVASILHKAIIFGDNNRLNFLLDRLIGKVKEEVDVNVVRPTIVKLLNNEGQVVLGAEQISLDQIKMDEVIDVKGEFKQGKS